MTLVDDDYMEIEAAVKFEGRTQIWN